MGRTLIEIARDMLYAQLNQDAAREEKLQAEVLDAPGFFAIESEAATEEMGNCGEFVPYINERKQIVLFLSDEEAMHFAIRNGILSTGYPVVTEVLMGDVQDMVNKGANKESRIEEVKVYSIPPISIVFKVSEFGGLGQEPENNNSQEVVEIGSCLQGINRLKTMLDTFDKAERRKLDPALRCENAHQVCMDLVGANRLDPDEIDRKLNFQVGFTRRFCTDIVSMETSKEALKKLLDYFGLGSYLYIYKDYSKELMEELRRNPVVDKYALKPARITTKEPFELLEMCRGQDELNSAYVYGLTLKSESRRVKIVVSNPSGCVVGRSYDIIGLSPITNQTEPKNEAATRPELSDARMQEILKSIGKKQSNLIIPSKPGTKLKGTPEEIQARQNYLIAYFKKRDGINFQAAEQKYKVLAEDPDVLEAFYLYIKDRQWGYLARHGYTPKRLVQELHYPPYEAYCIMIRLLTDTEKTITMLKHRAHEPQYQESSSAKAK